MRFKNFTLLFLMGIFGLFTTNLFAQEDATIAPENIRYWIGDGENEVIFIANWAEPDTALLQLITVSVMKQLMLVGSSICILTMVTLT